MKNNKKFRVRRNGIIGIDRSGSKGDFPLVVACVYSDKVSNFETAINEIRSKLKLKHGFIKGKDFKPNKYEKVIKILQDNKIKFLAYVINRKTYDDMKKRVKLKENWTMISEAYLWYKTINLFVKKLKILPLEILYERTYTGSGFDVFDNIFKNLVSKRMGIDKKSITIGEKTSPYIMVADWVAHFFYKTKRLSSVFKSNNIYHETEYIEYDLENLFNTERVQKCLPSTHSSRPNRLPMNVKTITTMLDKYLKILVNKQELEGSGSVMI